MVSNFSSGAIRRVAVERETTTSITYENFVADLDTGDSFAASLIDILVKVRVRSLLLDAGC